MFKNLDSFIGELENYLWTVHENAINAVEETLGLIEAKSQSYVPIKTGDLRDSFFTEVTVSKNRIIAVVGYDREGRIDYARLMHSGFWPNGRAINYRTTFQKTPKDHFLKRGILENSANWERILKDKGNV